MPSAFSLPPPALPPTARRDNRKLPRFAASASVLPPMAMGAGDIFRPGAFEMPPAPAAGIECTLQSPEYTPRRVGVSRPS